MEKEILKQFLNKKVRLRTSVGFFYRGTLKEVTNESICLDDVKLGTMFFSLSIISEIQQIPKEEA